MFGFEQANKYTVLDQDGSTVLLNLPNEAQKRLPLHLAGAGMLCGTSAHIQLVSAPPAKQCIRSA